MHVVVLPDHVPSAWHERTIDPCCLYPWLQEKETWEPNDDPHERDFMAPLIGDCIGGQVVSANTKIPVR